MAPTTVAQLEKTMAEQLKKLESSMEQNNEKMLEKMLVRLSDMIGAKINEKFKEVVEPLITEVTNLQARVHQLENRLKGMETHWDASKRQNNIIISGIPAKQKENLQEIIAGVFSQLGTENADYEYAQRLNTGTDPNKSLILLRFQHHKDKQQMMSRYFKDFNVHLNKITGFHEAKGRVYLNQDLSKESQIILKLVVSLRKTHKIASYRVTDGQIAIKTNKDDKNYRIISNIEALQLSQKNN